MVLKYSTISQANVVKILVSANIKGMFTAYDFPGPDCVCSGFTFGDGWTNQEAPVTFRMHRNLLEVDTPVLLSRCLYAYIF